MTHSKKPVRLTEELLRNAYDELTMRCAICENAMNLCKMIFQFMDNENWQKLRIQVAMYKKEPIIVTMGEIRDHILFGYPNHHDSEPLPSPSARL